MAELILDHGTSVQQVEIRYTSPLRRRIKRSSFGVGSRELRVPARSVEGHGRGGMQLHIELLQQEAHVVMMEVRNAIGVRRQREAQVLVEALGQRVVLGRNKGLDLDGLQ